MASAMQWCKNKWLYKPKRGTKTVALQKERQESLKRINLKDSKRFTFRYLGKLVSCSLVSGLHACKPAEPALPHHDKNPQQITSRHKDILNNIYY